MDTNAQARTLIKCENLAIGYNNNKLVSNINFDICVEDYICITGDNGTGKTTFLKTLLGQLKPISGELTYSNEFQKKDIGYLPQADRIHAHFPVLVKEIICSGNYKNSMLRPFYTKEEQLYARNIMEELDISHLEEKSYNSLSIGQKQRVLFGRALCSSKDMLIVDEPAKGLDKSSKNRIVSMIDRVHAKGTSILMVTHNPEHVLTRATHVIRLEHETFSFRTSDEYKER